MHIRIPLHLSLISALVLLSINFASAQTPYDIVADFGTTTARNSAAALLLASDGNYYGTTYLGGDDGRGTIFKMTPAGVITILHFFTGSEGSNPYSPLIEGTDGNLYGTTLNGAGAGDALGTIFKTAKDGTGFTTIHSLEPRDSTGCSPEGTGLLAPVIKGSDAIYGVVSSGDCSTGHIPFFRVSYAGAFSIIGHIPDFGTSSGLSRGADGYFYGTTEGGNASLLGMVYRISESGGVQKLHELTRAEGYAHTGELFRASDGKFYGTARAGGAFSSPAGNFEGGTIFQFVPGADEASSTYNTLYSFTENDAAGSEPYAGLVQGSNGVLYGTTLRTGANATNAGGSGGAIFSITTGGSLEPLFAFGSDSGFQPMGELIQAAPGRLFGTTFLGGSGLNAGVIFRFDFANATTTSLVASPTRSVFGQQITLTADVSSAGGPPTGQVEFLDGATSLGTAALNGGAATQKTTTLNIGNHILSARYLGDAGFLQSTSSNQSVTVNMAQTTTMLGSLPNPSSRKQVVTLTTSVAAAAPGGGIATGQVQFVDGKKKLGTATVVNGLATLQVSFTNMGTHGLTAIYSGDANFVGSSVVLTHMVNK
jgi:uncharacterized repeat protein (TIGR03803 family)